MKNIGKILIIFGVIVTLAGMIFSLQSKSVVGPASSFMYDNPEWTVNGSIIFTFGLIAAGIGGFMFLVARKKGLS